MMRDLFWRTLQEPGFEHLRLTSDAGGIAADGAVLGVFDMPTRAFRLRYHVGCDAGWSVRSVDAEISHPWQRQLALRADGRGRWTDAAGEELHELRGCSDVDLMTTPFTNTLPIRRLDWSPGTSHDVAVAYVTVPGLELSVDRQRYTCLARSDDSSRFRFESLVSGFVAGLLVDGDGLVLEYADIWARVAG